jgi:hypothetical protein
LSRHATLIGLLGLLAIVIAVQPSKAKDGYLRVTFTKGAVVGGVGAGRGVLTFEGRDYPFTVYGLSLGLAAGASITELQGRVAYMQRLSDFPGGYRSVGLGGALVGGAGGVQLKNQKGVIITLEGPRFGMEFSANLSRVRFALD